MGTAAQLTPLDNAAGDGEHIFQRPAGLGPDQVVGQIQAEPGRRQARHQGLAQIGIGHRQRHGGRQAARHLARETRARQDGRRGLGQGLLQDVGHQLQRAPLNALGAQDHGRAGPEVRTEGLQRAAQMLGRRHRQHQITVRQIGHVGRRADGRIQFDPRQEGGIDPVPGDAVDHLGLACL